MSAAASSWSMAKSYIQEHVEERLTLNDVSAAVHISPIICLPCLCASFRWALWIA